MGKTGICVTLATITSSVISVTARTQDAEIFTGTGMHQSGVVVPDTTVLLSNFEEGYIHTSTSDFA